MSATAAFEVAGDEGGWDAQHAVADALQDDVPVRVEAGAVQMNAAIDFDDEMSLTADEVGDEATDDHLAAERQPQAATLER